MKKTLTLLLVVLTSLTYAQVDLTLVSIDKPDFIKDGQSTTTLDVQFTISNSGDALSAGDSIYYNWALIRKTDNNLMVSSNPAVIILGEDLPSGGSVQSPVIGAGINGTIGTTTEIYFAVQAYLFDRGALPVDEDSTDNFALKEMLWEKQYGASVANLEYNNNVAAYPNPATNLLNVDLLFAESNAVTIELIDLNGKTVINSNEVSAITPNSYQLDVNAVEKGIYILKVTNGDKVTTSKVTITH
ncbi:MAG: T9SS type A sorting domain-containing protein [Bacteroidetes bacterium]|jgi:hypothetical protein|nr:T9SS type A sorting domain-containing protein [Bacteroidota bacterium]MDA8929911.1 T9SS type A sorting domain-containing protein [Bacteroidia bacterium]